MVSNNAKCDVKVKERAHLMPTILFAKKFLLFSESTNKIVRAIIEAFRASLALNSRNFFKIFFN